MPPRFAVAGILAFWLATTGFTFYRDVWPRLFASGPPPVSIELADEARQNVPAKWKLFRNGQPLGRLSTQMKYLDAEDAFAFTYRYNDLEFGQGGLTFAFPHLTTEVRMTRGGDLKGETVTALAVVRVGELELVSGTLEVVGTVADGVLTGRAELKTSAGGLLNAAGDLDPVPVPERMPLNPLQPVNRLAHVRGGERWTVHESDPLRDALMPLVRRKLAEHKVRLPDPPARESVVAEVGAEVQPLDWHGRAVPCWVIEYRRAEPFVRTWVQAGDGKVLRHEVFEKGENLTFEREE
jgi:hypothetical protein